jgi:hypothetical protein
MAVLIGIILDTSFYIFKYKNKGMYIGMCAMSVVEVVLLVFLYTQLKVPGTNFIINYWPVGIIAFAVLMCLGAFLGIKIFNRIKNKRAIKLIMNN